MKNSTQLRNIVAAARPGKKVEVTVLRDGKELTLSVVLTERPDASQLSNAHKETEHNWERVGIYVQDFDEETAKQLGYEGEQGIVVRSVAPGSPAQQTGLAAGDLIKQINHQPIQSIHDYGQILDKLQPGDSIIFLLKRGRNNFFVALRIPK